MPYGVPQGSNLGPLLFLTYINDLSSTVDRTTKLCVDDSSLLVNAPNPYQLETIINNNLKQMHEWTTANLITVNPIKSPVIIIPSKQRQVLPNFSIHINSSKILVHESAKYLGQGGPNPSPRATSGPRQHFLWPAEDSAKILEKLRESLCEI